MTESNIVQICERADWEEDSNLPEDVWLLPGAAAGEKWEADAFSEKEPAQKEEPLPGFPMDTLPEVLRRFCEAVAESFQVSADMPAVAALTAAALCVSKKYCICPAADWVEPLNLFTCIVARPSERKSPVERVIRRPLEAYEQRYNEAHRRKIREYNTRVESLNARIEGKRSQLRRGTQKGHSPDPAEIWTLEEDINALRHQLEELQRKPVRPLRLLADDSTQEALVGLMSAAGGKIGIFSTEGGIFTTAAGKYTNGQVNIDCFTKGYSGDTIQVDRIGRERETLKSPCLTMMVMLQPAVLQEIMNNQAFRGRGLQARFLYAIPASLVGSRKADPDAIPEDCQKGYEELISSLLDLPAPEEDASRQLSLSEDARRLRREMQLALEPRLAGDLAPIEDWAGKLLGQTMRIAGILHCCIHPDGPEKYPIGIGTLEKARRIGEYFLTHAGAAFRSAADKAAESQAEYVLRRMNGQSMSRSEIQHACRNRIPDTDQLTLILDELVRTGRLRREVLTTRGRPKELYSPLSSAATA